jgi:hypothetical protein
VVDEPGSDGELGRFDDGGGGRQVPQHRRLAGADGAEEGDDAGTRVEGGPRGAYQRGSAGRCVDLRRRCVVDPAVALAADGQQSGGLSGVVLDLAAQALDRHLDRAGTDGRCVAPDLGEQLVAAHDAPAGGAEVGQQGGLDGAQRIHVTACCGPCSPSRS